MLDSFDDNVDLSKMNTKFLVLRLHEKFESFERREISFEKRLRLLEDKQREEDILKKEALRRRAEKEEDLEVRQSRLWDMKLAIAGGAGAFIIWIIQLIQKLFSDGQTGT